MTEFNSRFENNKDTAERRFDHRGSHLERPKEDQAVQLGEINPVSLFTFLWENGILQIACPTCGDFFFVEIRDVDHKEGCIAYCPNSECDNISFIPGVFFYESSSQDAKVTGALMMPMNIFTKWLAHHPKTIQCGEDSVKKSCGVFLFCTECLSQQSENHFEDICSSAGPKCWHCQNLFVRVILIDKYVPSKVEHYHNFVIGYPFNTAFCNKPLKIIIKENKK